jgi:hypothetical protein
MFAQGQLTSEALAREEGSALTGLFPVVLSAAEEQPEVWDQHAEVIAAWFTNVEIAE